MGRAFPGRSASRATWQTLTEVVFEHEAGPARPLAGRRTLRGRRACQELLPRSQDLADVDLDAVAENPGLRDQARRAAVAALHPACRADRDRPPLLRALQARAGGGRRGAD